MIIMVPKNHLMMFIFLTCIIRMPSSSSMKGNAKDAMPNPLRMKKSEEKAPHDPHLLAKSCALSTTSPGFILSI